MSTPFLSITVSKRKGSLARVDICNPEHNGKSSTCARSAKSLVMRGLAVYVAPRVICLVVNIRASSSGSWEDTQVDKSIERNYAAGVVFWNGCDPHGQHLPGQMPAYHRPDWGAG